jgi:hypothetical protein
MPLFSHIARVPEHGELCRKLLEWIDFWKGRTFHCFPRKKYDEDKDPTKMEFIALILCFMVVQFKLIN